MTSRQLLASGRKEAAQRNTPGSRNRFDFQILKERNQDPGLMFGEGTLEILPDGFRLSPVSPDYLLLSVVRNDIYVFAQPEISRRFRSCGRGRNGGRPGRRPNPDPPTKNERLLFCPAAPIEAINGARPQSVDREGSFFDEFDPLHP